jgi:glycosyltransferase involved in cell wall biosynthesis
MKINLIGFKGDFSSSNGSGVGRYSYELYNNLDFWTRSKGTSNNIVQKYKKTVNVRFIEISPLFNKYSVLTNFIAAYKFMLFDVNSKADIWHFVTHNPAINGNFFRINKRAKITIATAIEFGYLNTFKTSKLGYEEFVSNKFKIKDVLGWEILQLILKGTLGADYLIAISSQTKNEAIKLGYPEDKISVVNLGLDDRYIKPFKLEETKEIFKVGYIGTLRKRKNVKFAIEAINLIDDKKVYFDIYGKGPDYKYLNGIIKNKNISMKGFAPEDKIVDIYDSFDVYVHPVMYTGFELEILEAQSRGLPVIIYKYGKIPKEVRKYCFEAESPEHMAQIIEDLKENGYNEKLRNEATEYARSFTWERCARETLEVYKKVYNKYY